MSFIDENFPPGYAILEPETWNQGYEHHGWFIRVLTVDNDVVQSDDFDLEEDARRWAWWNWVDSILGVYSWERTDPEYHGDRTMAVISKGGHAKLCRREHRGVLEYWIEDPITEETHWHGEGELESLVHFASITMQSSSRGTICMSRFRGRNRDLDVMDKITLQKRSRANLEKKLRDAAAIYSNHIIVSRTESSWRIQREDGRCDFWTDIIVGHRGSVIITGDGPDIILRSWRNTESAPERLNLIDWAGEVDISYLKSKVVAGRKSDYDGEQAFIDILLMLDSLLEEEAICKEQYHDLWSWLRSGRSWGEEEAISKEQYDDLSPNRENFYVEEGHAKSIWEDIYTITGDSELDCFGLVPSSALLYAQAACFRLSFLLYAEINAEKTP